MTRRLIFLLVAAVMAGCTRQPDQAIQLRLALDKGRGPAAESVSFVLEIKNAGRRAVDILEPIGRRGSRDCIADCIPSPFSGAPRTGTSIESFGPDGQSNALLVPLVRDGAPDFWIDDCGGGQRCKQIYPGWVVRLSPGRTLTTAPSESLSFFFIKPGRYRLKAAYESPDGSRIESTVVEYEALPSPKAERLAREGKKSDQANRRKMNRALRRIAERVRKPR